MKALSQDSKPANAQCLNSSSAFWTQEWLNWETPSISASSQNHVVRGFTVSCIVSLLIWIGVSITGKICYLPSFLYSYKIARHGTKGICRPVVFYSGINRYLWALQYFSLYRTTWYSRYFSVRGTRDCCSWLLSSVKWLHLRSFLYQRILNLNLIFAFPRIRPGSAVWRFCLLKITCTGWYIRELSHCNVSPDNINKGGWGWNGTTGRFSSFITTFVFRASSRRVDEDSSVRTVSPCRLVDSYWHASCISVNVTRNTVCKFEWSHPVVLSEYLLYYNMFPSTQLTFKYNINATCFDDDCHKSKRVSLMLYLNVSCVDGNML